MEGFPEWLNFPLMNSRPNAAGHALFAVAHAKIKRDRPTGL